MDQQKPSILIIDDEPSSWGEFVVSLEKKYSVICAETGDQALDVLRREENIDLILLRHNQPVGLDGLKILERINELNQTAPVIFITEEGSEEVAVRAFRLGAREYLSKPFNFEELRSIIENVLRPHELEIPPMNRAIDFIDEYYCQPISARDVAREVGLSLSYVQHIFKKGVGKSITNYIQELRVEKAKELLSDHSLRIKEIATKTGFNNQYYFFKVFKKSVGCSPSEYREKSK